MYYSKSSSKNIQTMSSDRSEVELSFSDRAQYRLSFGKSKELIKLESLKCDSAEKAQITPKISIWSEETVKAYKPSIDLYRERLIENSYKISQLKKEIATLLLSVKSKNSREYQYLSEADDLLYIAENVLKDNELRIKEVDRMMPCIGVDDEFFQTLQQFISARIPPQIKDKAFNISELESAAHGIAEARQYISGEKTVESEDKKTAQNSVTQAEYGAIAYIQNLRVEAEVYYDLNDMSTGFCASNKTINSRPDIKIVCKDSKNAYAISTALEKGIWCVDSMGYTGRAMSINSQLACVK